MNKLELMRAEMLNIRNQAADAAQYADEFLEAMERHENMDLEESYTALYVRGSIERLEKSLMEVAGSLGRVHGTLCRDQPEEEKMCKAEKESGLGADPLFPMMIIFLLLYGFGKKPHQCECGAAKNDCPYECGAERR